MKINKILMININMNKIDKQQINIKINVFKDKECN